MSAAEPAYTQLVVTLGTDHHRFDRLLVWMARWLAATPHDVVCVVQHGATPLPGGLTGVALLPHEDMLRLVASANVVVAQGGPGSVMDARSSGHLPIVVPRRAALREVVDDHQVSFCRRLSQTGQVALAEDEATLHALLDRAVAEPEHFLVVPSSDHVPQTVQRFGVLVENLVTRRPSAWSGRRRHRLQP